MLVGPGRVREVVQWIEHREGPVAVVTGRSLGNFSDVVEGAARLKDRILEMRYGGGEPELSGIMSLVDEARLVGIRSVVAIGGGSVIDTAKAIAALVAQPMDSDPMDFLEVIGGGQPLEYPALPVMAVPTTAGTGAEATRNAVIGSPAHRVKVSLRHPSMVPDMVILDPELTLKLPRSVTASTGMDALTQLAEAFVTRNRNPFTDGFCREGLGLAARSLEVVFDNPDRLESRQDMLLAGYFSGVALANAGLGAVHGFAGPMGGMFGIPHGEICATLLPTVFQHNSRIIHNRPADESGVADLRNRFLELARIICRDPTATVESLLHRLKQFRSLLGIRSLREMGVESSGWPRIIEKAGAASSMKGNPVPLGADDLEEILRNA